ncbi:unnamed protein product [Euphydryas editha]|uniref:Uncharacterized protein n=1 Tax=Euphydryas editha TaxID=104508 RepID=A0AAU9T9Z0_EUPED|nr:unnamed protein product [Euphydryas editha]
MDVNNGVLNEYYKKIATEFCKYEVLSHTGPKSKKVQDEINNAYNELAKVFKLANVATVKMEIQKMKKYVSKKIRLYIRQSIINGGAAKDAIDHAPQWMKLIDKRLNLLQRSCMVETLNSMKYYHTRQRVCHFTLEIIQSARRAAARALASDGGGDGRRGGGRRRGGDTRIALTGAEAMREYADNIDVDVDILHRIWVRIYAQSIYKLMALVEVGDFADALGLAVRPSHSDWLVVDSGLLYDTRLKLISEVRFFLHVNTFTLKL